MEVIEYFKSDNKEHWLSQLGKCDWSAGRRLRDLLRDGRLQEYVGENTEVLMLVDGESLVSFCTLADMDDIQPTELTPLIGWVYTFPEYRGRRCFGQLLDYAENLAQDAGHDCAYISTNHVGLYEKYGCEFFATMKDIDGDDSRVYVKYFF